MLAPEGRLTTSEIESLPLTALPLAPPAATDVQVTPVIVAGNASVTLTPVASDGTALLTTIV
jgi:hypothetical protein